MVDDVALMEEIMFQDADENGETPAADEVFDFSSLVSNDVSGAGNDWLNEMIAERTSQPDDEQPDTSAEHYAKVDTTPDLDGLA